MWTTLLVVSALFLVSARVFLTTTNQAEVVPAGLTATACLMIALAVLPLVLKLTLLLAILAAEGWFIHRSAAFQK